MPIRFRIYFIKQALVNIKDNLTVHILGLGTMVSALLIFGIFLFLFENVSNWVREWGNPLSFSVYLRDDISAYKRDKIDSFMRRLPGEKKMRYISKKDAMADLKATFGSDAALLNRLSHNPLPASYEIYFDGEKKHHLNSKAVKEALLKLDGVTDVQCSEEWLNNFQAIMDIVERIGFVVSGLLCLCVVFIVTNTIKLTIFYRKTEIEILKLVGATDWFIKLPFLLEGAIQGILAGVLVLSALLFGYWFVITKDVYFFGMNPLNFVFLPFGHAVLLFSASVGLGVIGSMIAIGRFFKV